MSRPAMHQHEPFPSEEHRDPAISRKEALQHDYSGDQYDKAEGGFRTTIRDHQQRQAPGWPDKPQSAWVGAVRQQGRRNAEGVVIEKRDMDANPQLDEVGEVLAQADSSLEEEEGWDKRVLDYKGERITVGAARTAVDELTQQNQREEQYNKRHHDRVPKGWR